MRVYTPVRATFSMLERIQHDLFPVQVHAVRLGEHSGVFFPDVDPLIGAGKSLQSGQNDRFGRRIPPRAEVFPPGGCRNQIGEAAGCKVHRGTPDSIGISPGYLVGEFMSGFHVE